jgi:tetrahydromethanopterin S-methyltransferase subunit G
VNEWRQTFGDIANKGVTQDMFNTRYDEITRRLNVIEQALANMVGKTLGYSAGVGAVVLIIAIVTQLLNLGG